MLAPHRPLLIPPHRQVLPQLLQAKAHLRSASPWQAVEFVSTQDRFDDVGGEAGQAQHPADVSAVAANGVGSTTGDYVLQVVLNATAEEEPYSSVPNDEMSSAENLDGSFVGLLPGAARGAVVGSLPSTHSLVAMEDFESGALGPAWTTWSSDSSGRVEVTGEPGTAGGSYALWMDCDNNSIHTLNEAIWTVDLTGLTDATLSFQHAEYRDHEQEFGGDFTGHRYADGFVDVGDLAVLGAYYDTVLTPPPGGGAAAAGAAGGGGADVAPGDEAQAATTAAGSSRFARTVALQAAAPPPSTAVPAPTLAADMLAPPARPAAASHRTAISDDLAGPAGDGNLVNILLRYRLGQADAETALGGRPLRR